MSIEGHRIIVHGIPVQVIRKPIKNLHLGVYPPEGRVRVAAPLRVDDDAVRIAVITRLAWVRRRQACFRAQERQSARKCVSGESHYFQGRRYRLDVVEQSGAPRVAVRNNTTIVLQVPPRSSGNARRQIMQAWHRRQLKALIPPLIAKWEAAIGVQVAAWGVKRMKTKWGSCNREARRIWLNLELAKKPVHCLEYIVVHELVHLLERRHDARFAALMDKHLANWRLYRDELNSAPLAHERWDY
jgi:predicted metal-dependent hydrolase